MASAIVRELLDSGIHFGSHASRWNPKMKSYIYAKRNALHIIDIRETLKGLLRAQKFIARVVSRGEDILFVGTKRQAREPIAAAAERCGMHAVTERWLGGMLTNFRTIRTRLQRLEELEALVASPQWETGYSKKMQSQLSRELDKIRRNLNGVRKMTRLPGALMVVDIRKEVNALREASSLGIPTVGLIDTDSDPDLVSIPIPGNDDSMRAIQFVLSKIADAAEESRRSRPELPPQGPDRGEEMGGRRRGGRGGRGGDRGERGGRMGGGGGRGQDRPPMPRAAMPADGGAAPVAAEAPPTEAAPAAPAETAG